MTLRVSERRDDGHKYGFCRPSDRPEPALP